MIVDGPWITEPATQAVCAAMADQGFQVYFVGGCVRNALLGVEVSDIDLASDALPEDTIRCAEAAGLRAIPTGIEHGTIAVVSGGVAHEITTFRSDVETHGRRAEVRFSKSVKEDAERRDFTMNAIYAGPDGTILDPLNGLPDLVRRHVRFIGDAGQRIQEDYLRSLRFFRFTAWYGDPALGIDSEGLAAVAAHLDGLSGLSRERVGAEIKKLLAAPDPSMAVAAMAPIGAVFTFIALVTGSAWGKPMWGTWWVWDARLTSELVLLFLYVGVIALWHAFDDRRLAGRAAGILVLIGVVNLPVIHYSVEWWNTLHQGSTRMQQSIDPAMRSPLRWSIFGFLLLSATLTLMRMRNLILLMEKRRPRVSELILKRGRK